MIKKQNNIFFMVLFMPVLFLVIAFLFFISIKDNVSIRFFEESYLFDNYLMHIISILIIISLSIDLTLLVIKINKNEMNDYGVSDWFHEVFVFVVRFFVIGLLFYYPVRGCFLIGNRTFGKQTKMQVAGKIIDYTHVYHKGGYDNNVYIYDENLNRTINLRVKDNTVFRKGDSISLEMTQGSLGILYKKY